MKELLRKLTSLPNTFLTEKPYNALIPVHQLIWILVYARVGYVVLSACVNHCLRCDTYNTFEILPQSLQNNGF